MATETDHYILHSISPMPKQQHRPTSSRAKVRSAIIIDTAEKHKMLEKMLMPNKKRFLAGAKRARYASSTSSELAQDDQHSLLSSNAKASDSVTDSEQSSNEEDSSRINVNSVEVNCYVAIVITKKHYFKQFVGKVLAGPDSEKDYTISFLVRSPRFKNGFVFPEKEDTKNPEGFATSHSYCTAQRLFKLVRFAMDLSTVE